MRVSERDAERAQARAMLTISLAFSLAPFASSAPTTSKWPFKEALWSGVRPSCGAGQHRGQGLFSRKYMLARSHECMQSLLSFRSHTQIHARSPIHASHAQLYTDTSTHACTHPHPGWGRHRYFVLAAATYCGSPEQRSGFNAGSKIQRFRVRDPLGSDT
jgi:hypothetical protein